MARAYYDGVYMCVYIQELEAAADEAMLIVVSDLRMDKPAVRTADHYCLFAYICLQLISLYM